MLPEVKSNTGFTGLKNLGCTCYLNSLIQQLFMITSFRGLIVESEDLYEDTNITKEESPLFQLRVLFNGLQLYEGQYYNYTYYS